MAPVVEGLEFTVRGSGRGIAPEDIERFSQAGNPDQRGLGLGLCIVRCLVEAHGGKIRAVSEPGSAFHFTTRKTPPS